ncbi:MFS transporter [Streptomyces tritici]|uniref:MFS transporter n=1 Tax=Streptomyces tritici TaxID=2054410 RepID=UPI003AF021FF
MAGTGLPGRSAKVLRRVLVPVALAQFICSFAGSNMNVMINDISEDLDTTVQGVQVAITLFLLVMAALMIPGGRLSDRYGRKRCFLLGLVVYGIGALLSAVAPGLGVLILGNSILEGIGTALLIPPAYILTTLLFRDVTSRARAFGVVMAAGGVGAAAGPLIGGLITTWLGWRASFGFQALVIAVIVLLSRHIEDPVPPDRTRPFDTAGAVLSAVGLTLVVMGVLAADESLWLTLGLLALGALALLWFFRLARAREAAGKEPLISTSLFRDRVANLGLVTQNVQWLMLMGASFTVAAYLQVVRGYSAIGTGVVFTAATLGLLVSSLAAERLAKRRPQRTLVITGFVVSLVGIAVLIALVYGLRSAWAFVPGLLLLGLGLGVMLTPSVNVVQSSFPEERQGEISGLSRSVSNLGSSMGTAIAGTILVAGLSTGAYAVAMIALAVVGLVGLAAAVRLPRSRPATADGTAVRKESSPARALLSLVVTDPGHLPELLADFAVRRNGPAVPKTVARLRREHPDATEQELRARVVASGRRRVVSEGALVGGPFIVLVPFAFCAALLSQARTILELAALDGRDPTDGTRAAELLVLQGVYEDVGQARAALVRTAPAVGAPVRRRRWTALWGITVRMARLLGVITPSEEDQGEGGRVRRAAVRTWRWLLLAVVFLVGLVAPLVWLPYMAVSYRRADARLTKRVLAYYFGDGAAVQRPSVSRAAPEAVAAAFRALLSLLVPIALAVVTFLTGLRIADSSWPVLGIALAAASAAVGALWYWRRHRHRTPTAPDDPTTEPTPPDTAQPHGPGRR